MKRCPQCGAVYSDDNSFCLNDGTALIGTLASGDIPTQVISRSAPLAPAINPSPWLYVLLGVLATTVIAIAVFAFWPRETERATRSVLPTPTVAENTRTPSNNKPVANTLAPSPPVAAAPTPRRPMTSTQRVRFAKGAVSTSLKGTLGAADVRHFVLACRANQSLNARVFSNSGCVTFTPGSAEFSSLTVRGDNRVSLQNQCGQNQGFRLEITVL